MFRSLRIKNLALVDEVTWELKSGFNILTGETGAGKSILIGALQLLVGERADKTLIRSGEDTCMVEAEFEINDEELYHQIARALDDAGVEACEDRLLLLKRMVSASGSNRQFVNGSAVPLQFLKKIGEWIVDIHGPHDHQSLLSNATQLDLLDAFAKLKTVRSALRQCYQDWRKAQDKLMEHQLSPLEVSEKIDALKFQIEEIRGAAIEKGEEEKLNIGYRVATHAKQLLEYAHEIHHILEEGEDAVESQLARVEKLLRQWVSIDSSAQELLQKNHDAVAALRELTQMLRDRIEESRMDSEHLHNLELRMDLFQRLKRKYGVPLDDLEAIAIQAEIELEQLTHHESYLLELNKAADKCFAEAKKIADELHSKRIDAAKELSIRVESELRELGFLQSIFQVKVKKEEQLEATGFDHVEFMFSPNQGEALKPLKMIASSGEMARVMLAIKTTLAAVDEVPVLIFDEVDANVGGTTASKVGAKLQGLGKWHQVICITHLPQVAAFGHKHYLVEKEVKNERTFTRLRLLSDMDRRVEIARMLGGEHKEAIALADKLIHEASKQ
jgi:DNA repair protein RecN (Recombination protein N)